MEYITMSKFKVGDIVKYTNEECNPRTWIGSLFEVIGLLKNNEMQVKCIKSNSIKGKYPFVGEIYNFEEYKFIKFKRVCHLPEWF